MQDRLSRSLLALLLVLGAAIAGCDKSPLVDADGGSGVPPGGIILVTVEGGWSAEEEQAFLPEGAWPGALRSTDGMTPCPQVRPAVSSLLTGQAPDRTGVRDDTSLPLPDDVPFVPELLRREGWRTAAFAANPLLGHGSGLERGFELFDAPKRQLFGPTRRFPRMRESEEVVSNLLTWLDSLPNGEPFFAWAHVVADSAREDLRADRDEEQGGDPPEPDLTARVATPSALAELVKRLDEEERFRDAAVILVGTSGPLNLTDGRTSGYFLVPQVLRVPGIYRPGREAGTAFGDGFYLPDVAAWILDEAGLSAPVPDGKLPTTPAGETRARFAWTWRGAREFGWPVQAAVVHGDRMLVLGQAGAPGQWLAWPSGEELEPSPVPNLEAELAGRPAWREGAQAAIPTIPGDLLEALKAFEIEIPVPAPATAPLPVAERMQVIPKIDEARRLALGANPRRPARTYRAAIDLDPGNIGARVEAGEILALTGAAEPSRELLEQALGMAPYNPEAWHWLGHTYMSREWGRAEAMLRLSDFLAPHNGDVLYDLACARSLADDLEPSLDYLRRAWKAGFRNVDHMQADADLRNLRADPRFARFMSEVVR